MILSFLRQMREKSMGSDAEMHRRIGMRKAGSEAIQHVSLANRDAVAGHGFHDDGEIGPGARHRKVFLTFGDAIDVEVAALAMSAPGRESVVFGGLHLSAPGAADYLSPSVAPGLRLVHRFPALYPPARVPCS